MIDIHCHILPGIDDGAENLEQAVELSRIAENQNITAVVATPHFFDFEHLDDFTDERNSAYNSLVSANKSEGISTEIFLGAEVYLDDHLFFAPNIDELTINGSRYMLSEFSLHEFDPNLAVAAAEELISRGYVPIIAHPERYQTFQEEPDTVNKLSKLGVLFQLNADSLLGLNGASAFELACAMYINNIVDFIGSDAHSPSFRANDILDKSKYFPEIFDGESLHKLLKTNPDTIIQNKDYALPERGQL